MSAPPPSEPPLLVALGCGTVATALARRLRARGWRVIGATRDGRALGMGIAPVAFRAERGGVAPEGLSRAVIAADAVLCSIPPDDSGCPALAALEGALRGGRGWRGYLSTTGVYGHLGGRWAFEWSAVNPNSPTAARRALAETQWRALDPPAHVFRLPGIYGPGRSAFDKLREGSARRIDKPGQVFSRVHVEDIATALEASIARPHPGRIYNVCDDEPGPQGALIAHAAALLGIDPPPEIPFAAADLSPQARRFYEDSRRVSNARAKAELGWRPRFASYREGLAAILDEERR